MFRAIGLIWEIPAKGEKEDQVAKTAICKDTGQNCDFVIQGDTEEELLANAAQHGTDAYRIGAQEDEYARTFGRDFISAPGIGAGIVGERASWLKKVKDAIREE